MLTGYSFNKSPFNTRKSNNMSQTGTGGGGNNGGKGGKGNTDGKGIKK